MPRDPTKYISSPGLLAPHIRPITMFLMHRQPSVLKNTSTPVLRYPCTKPCRSYACLAQFRRIASSKNYILENRAMHWNSGGGEKQIRFAKKKTVACYKKTQEDKSWMQPRMKMGMQSRIMRFTTLRHRNPQSLFPATVD